MRSKLFVGFLLILLFVPRLGTAQTINWRADAEAALAEAQQAGKLLMVDVYTDWCGWCKELDKVTYSDKKVIDKSNDFIPLKLNPESGAAAKSFTSRYPVRGYPTILFIVADGTLVGRIAGFADAPTLLDVMSVASTYGPGIKSFLNDFTAGDSTKARNMLPVLVKLGMTANAMTVFDKLDQSHALSPGIRQTIALGIARQLVDYDQYELALRYVRIVEAVDSGSDDNREAGRLHAVCIFYTEGKSPALQYVDQWLSDPRTPEAWHGRFQQLRDRMVAVKDPKDKQ
jgi:thioredoxin-related protein